MPRTAPTVDGSGNYREITLKWIDANNKRRSDTQRVSAAATDAQIEAVVVAMAVVSNANNYQVKVSMVYNSVANPGDATEAPILAVTSNIVLLFKDSAGNAVDWFVPAPKDEILVAGSNNVDSSNTELIAVRDAIDAAIPTAYEPVSYRFTNRRAKNPTAPA